MTSCRSGGVAGIVFELELAAVIGADEQIGGFTIMNDWLAPASNPQAPRLRHQPRAGRRRPTRRDAPQAVVRVNGEEMARADVVALRFGWPEMIQRASLNTRLLPGDVLGSGALLRGDARPLMRGDRVELEVGGIGVLENSVA